MCVFVCAYRELREMESEGDTQASGSSAARVDWAEAFKSPEFCAGLAEAIAKVIGTRAASSSQVTDLEQLGDVCPSAMSSATTTGTHSSREGMLTVPSFIGVSESVSLSQSRTTGQGVYTKTMEPPLTLPTVSSGPSPGLNQAFILGPGRPPIPAKLVAQILAYKFVEMSDFIPENLETPTTGTPSFIIDGCSIVPTTSSSRKRSEVNDILTWVECFNSYITVLTAFRPERSRDLLTYMALIIRIAKQFPGRCWYNYDRAYRLEAAASNSKNWSQIHSDLYHYHTSVAFQSAPPQVSRNREPRGDQSSPIVCKSWNLGACTSPR